MKCENCGTTVKAVKPNGEECPDCGESLQKSRSHLLEKDA